MKKAMNHIRDTLTGWAEQIEAGETPPSDDLRALARVADAQREMLELGLVEAGE